MQVLGLTDHGLGPRAGLWPQSGPALLQKAMPSVDEALKCLGGSAFSGLGGNFSATPARFIFRPRTGRINWRLLHSLDLDRVVHDGDVDTIQAHMDNIMFARFGREDLEITTDECIIKVVKLAQLCMEFLYSMTTSSQSLLQGLIEKVRVQAAQLKAAEARGTPRNHSTAPRSSRRRSLSREDPHRRGLGSGHGTHRKCPYCTKRFQSEQYLHEHIMRRHPGDFFAGAMSSQPPTTVHQPEPSPAVSLHPPLSPGARQAPPLSPPHTPGPGNDFAPDHLAQALDGATSSLREQLQGIQRDFGDALRAMRSDVGRVADDVRCLQTQNGTVPSPRGAPPSPGQAGKASSMVVHQAPAAPNADASALERRHMELEKKLEANQRTLLNKIEAVAMASPSGPVDTAHLDQFRQMQSEMQNQMKLMQQNAEQVNKMAADAVAEAAAGAKVAAADAAAEVARSVAKFPAASPAPAFAPEVAASRALAAAVATPVLPPPAPSREVVQQDFAAVSKAKAKAPKGRAPETSPVTAMDAVTEEPGPPRPPSAWGGAAGPLSDPGAGVGDLELPKASLVDDAIERLRPAGTAKFQKAWNESLDKLETEEEKLLFTIAMTQERTRHRRPGAEKQAYADISDLEREWSQDALLPQDKGLERQMQKRPLPDPTPEEFSNQTIDPTVKPGEPGEKMETLLVQRAFQNSFRGFLARCRPQAAVVHPPLPPPSAPAPAASSQDDDTLQRMLRNGLPPAQTSNRVEAPPAPPPPPLNTDPRPPPPSRGDDVSGPVWQDDGNFRRTDGKADVSVEEAGKVLPQSDAIEMMTPIPEASAGVTAAQQSTQLFDHTPPARPPPAHSPMPPPPQGTTLLGQSNPAAAADLEVSSGWGSRRPSGSPFPPAMAAASAGRNDSGPNFGEEASQLSDIVDPSGAGDMSQIPTIIPPSAASPPDAAGQFLQGAFWPGGPPPPADMSPQAGSSLPSVGQVAGRRMDGGDVVTAVESFDVGHSFDSSPGPMRGAPPVSAGPSPLPPPEVQPPKGFAAGPSEGFASGPSQGFATGPSGSGVGIGGWGSGPQMAQAREAPSHSPISAGEAAGGMLSPDGTDAVMEMTDIKSVSSDDAPRAPAPVRSVAQFGSAPSAGPFQAHSGPKVDVRNDYSADMSVESLA